MTSAPKRHLTLAAGAARGQQGKTKDLLSAEERAAVTALFMQSAWASRGGVGFCEVDRENRRALKTGERAQERLEDGPWSEGWAAAYLFLGDQANLIVRLEKASTGYRLSWLSPGSQTMAEHELGSLSALIPALDRQMTGFDGTSPHL